MLVKPTILQTLELYCLYLMVWELRTWKRFIGCKLRVPFHNVHIGFFF